MFWRRTRAAIAGFHPLHQALIWHRGFSAGQRPVEWAALAASLAGHAAVVKRRKWALPPRTTDVLLPLIQILCQDVAPNGVLAVTADLRGPGAPGKAGPRRELRVSRPIRGATEWFVVDPWLRLRAQLHDGSVLELAVSDRIRHRHIRKTSRSGRYKTKTKHKQVQLVRATRVLPKGREARRPEHRPPPWIRVRLGHGKRSSLTASAKLRDPAAGYEEVHRILTVVAEPFRWTSRPTTDQRGA